MPEASFSTAYTEVAHLLRKPWEEAHPDILDPKTLVGQLVRNYNVSDDLSTHIAATVITSFSKLKYDREAHAEAIANVLRDPIGYSAGFAEGWRQGASEAIADTVDGYQELLNELLTFLEDYVDYVADYLEAISDLSTLSKLLVSLSSSTNRELEETIKQLYDIFAVKHPEVASVMLDFLDRINTLAALQRIFLSSDSDAIIKSIVAEIGPLLTAHWQGDIDRYMSCRKNPNRLGLELGRDYGRISIEIILVIVGF